MVDAALIRDIAVRLRDAERRREPIDILSLDFPRLGIPEAYAIQRETLRLRLGEGRQVRGHKIGLTSRAMQLAVGIDEPDFGFLLDDMFFDDQATIPTDRFIAPRVEAELAFVLCRDLHGGDCTVDDVLAATDFICPALEILDTRVRRSDPRQRGGRSVVDTISDNAANAALVLGSQRIDPRTPELRWISALVSRNGRIEETGVAAGVLDHPANGIVWLARRLAQFGEGLLEGQVVLSGSFIRPIDAAAGDAFHADYGRYGSVSCRFG